MKTIRVGTKNLGNVMQRLFDLIANNDVLEMVVRYRKRYPQQRRKRPTDRRIHAVAFRFVTKPLVTVHPRWLLSRKKTA